MTPSSTDQSLRIQNTVGYYIAFIALGISASVVGPTLPRLAENTSTTVSQISLILTARSFGYMAGSFLGGRLLDRLPGHMLVAAFLTAVTILSLVSPLISVLAILGIVFFLWGMADGGVDLGANNLLLWTHREKSPPFMNGLHFFFGVGAFLAPVIVAQALALTDSIQLAYSALLVIAIPAAVWLIRLPSPSHSKAEDSQDSNRLPVNMLLVVLASLFFFLYVGMEIGYGSWLATYAIKSDLMNEEAASYLTSVFWGSLTLGRLLSVPLATRFQPRTLLILDLIGNFVGIVAISLTANEAVLWVGTAVMGLSQASIFPTLLSFVEQHMTITARASSWFFVFVGGSGIATPPIIGYLIDNVDPRAMMWAILGYTILAMCLFAYILRRFPRRKGQAI